VPERWNYTWREKAQRKGHTPHVHIREAGPEVSFGETRVEAGQTAATVLLGFRERGLN